MPQLAIFLVKLYLEKQSNSICLASITTFKACNRIPVPINGTVVTIIKMHILVVI